MKKIKYVIPLILVIAIFMQIGCSSSISKKTLSVKKMQDDEFVVAYFLQNNVTVTKMELVRRQTNIDAKEDYAYVNVLAENESVILNSIYIIKSIYYDIGGWQIKDIYPETVAHFEPKREPNVTDIEKIIPTMAYASAQRMEIDKGMIKQESITKLNNYEYEIRFTLKETGKIALIEAPYISKLKFNTESGIWDNKETRLLENEIKTTILASSGMYKLEKTKVSFVLQFCDDKLYIKDFDNNSDTNYSLNIKKDSAIELDYAIDSGLGYSFWIKNMGMITEQGMIQIYPDRLVYNCMGKYEILTGPCNN